MRNLFEVAHHCLMEADPDRKVTQTRAMARLWRDGELAVADWDAPRPIEDAGHPPLPELVHPKHLPRRTLADAKGRAALIHAVTHIEFNAINLAWDAVYRFRALPRGYYGDWVEVADDEARHFLALRGRLRELGFDYGAFSAHKGLWEMALRTAHDPLARMALVPRVLEARGLDVTPDMIKRLRGVGDEATAQILEMVLREEVAHVAAGSRWFKHLCRERGLESESTFFDLLSEFQRGAVRCPLHLEARREAGFSDSELERLKALCR